MGGRALILLDTHAWVWFINEPGRIGARARRAIEQAKAESGVFISCISTWEIFMLAANGRLEFAIPVETWVHRCERLAFLHFVPVNNDVAQLAVSRCAAMHGDPADRMIVATALYLGSHLATCDKKIQAGRIANCLW